MKKNHEELRARETKDAFWQYIRGVCIICVVLIHCKSGSEYKDAFNGSWNFDYWLVLRQLINFPVAIFIFLAGYFTNIEAAEKFSRAYLWERGKRLLLPFLMWSSFYTLIHVIAAHGAIDITKIIALLFLGLSSAQLYYILVLLQLTLLTPFLTRAIQIGCGTKLLLLVTPLYVLGLYCYSAVFHAQLLFYQVFFPAWFLFYYIGLWIKLRGSKLLFQKINFQTLILACCSAILISVLEAYLLLAFDFTSGFASSQIKVSSFLYAFMLINLLIVIRPYVAMMDLNWLKYVGDNSYGIYFVHYFWTLIISKLLVRLVPFVMEVLPAYHLVQAISAIGLSLFSIVITRNILGKRLSNRLLGF